MSSTFDVSHLLLLLLRTTFVPKCLKVFDMSSPNQSPVPTVSLELTSADESKIAFAETSQIADGLVTETMHRFNGKTGVDIISDVIILYMDKRAFEDLVDKFIHHQDECIKWSQYMEKTKECDMEIRKDGFIYVSHQLCMQIAEIVKVLRQAKFAVDEQLDVLKD